MSTHRRVPTRSTHLDDPFFTSPNLSTTPEKTLHGCTGSGEDAKSETTMAANASIFGNAPLYTRPSSAIKLPSSPTSRKHPAMHKSLDRSTPPLRASSIFLNASAAPFQPKAASPINHEGIKRSISYQHWFGEILRKGVSTMPAVKQSREQGGNGRKELHREASTAVELFKSPQPSTQLAEEACSNFRPILPFHLDTTTYSTPVDTNQHWSLAQDKRKLAYSDEPSFYQHPRTPRHASSPSPMGKNWKKKSSSKYYHHLQPPGSGYNLWTQHPPNSQAFRSIIQPSFHKSRTSHFDNFNRVHCDQERVNKMLNDVDQGPFQGDRNGDTSQSSIFDHYSSTSSVAPQTNTASQNPINPYSQDGSTISTGAYFPGSTNYPQQLQHHLYAALPPHRDLSQPNQRTAKDFFIPENMRQTLARKAEASLMTIPNSTLPPTIAHYHSLVPLVHNSQKNTTLFGYPSHAYKATSGLDGKLYCLRRLQGYRLNEASSEHAVRNVQQNWKRVRNGNVVTVHLAFTNSSFGDSSLVFVTDFHPLAETLAQRHFTPTSRYANRWPTPQLPEQTLWGYVVQIANALKAIHSAGLAARVIDPSKILLTGENRIRLNACGIVDVIHADSPPTLVDNQRLDLYLLGRLILALGSNNTSQHNQGKAMEVFFKSYTPRLKEITNWLLDHVSPHRNDSIDSFLVQIAGDMMTVFDNSLHQHDALESALARELENSRMVRLMTKMNLINERPEYEHDRQWAEHGNRYCIKLFRDYVFHQVDAQGNPVLDLAHVLACLNKLDAGSEEKIMLTTRDEETVIVVNYKELKACIEGAWQDLNRRAA
ncbi:MAG: hypothetical protein LQ343_002628 [Gyalolechia ehrenbergii]|nr:MAG: hypothetical protein LQ343_002628 [Gyalolechia ehrenbergii]